MVDVVPARALVFDFDGLIVDTEGPVYQAWAEVYERHGERLSLDFWKTIIGRGSNYFDPVADLEERLGRRLDAETLRAERRRREWDLVQALPVLPGVREWREEAAALGVKLGVASSSRRAWVIGHLDRLALGDWGCICCIEDAPRPKPAPDLYRAVLECLEVPPAEAIAVEDSTHGVAAAKAAGLYCVAVPNGLTAEHDFSQADLTLRSLAEVPFAQVAAGLRSGRFREDER